MRCFRILSLLGMFPLAGCTSASFLAAPPSTGVLLSGVGAALLLNTALTLLIVWAWTRRRSRIRSRRVLIEDLARELRHLRHWAGEEGVLRKVGLLRELGALGAPPPDLTGCELGGADLSGLQLSAAILRGANLAGANLQGARLAGADLFGAALTEANLSLAELRGARLRGANLRRAQLIKADLRGANLQRSNLVDADLQGALLEGAILTRARFADGAGHPFQAACHRSVEDWIRARLDADGRYGDESGEAGGATGAAAESDGASAANGDDPARGDDVAAGHA